MRIYFEVLGEFFVQSMTAKIVIDNHYKKFTDQSELSALSARCINTKTIVILEGDHFVTIHLNSSIFN